VANLIRARLSYNFTPRLYLQSLVQYNDEAEIWSTNLRFGWLQTANTGLFIVFNQVNLMDVLCESDRFLYGFDATLNRSLTIKYTRLIDVFK
jgi:hypothetical protein